MRQFNIMYTIHNMVVGELWNFRKHLLTLQSEKRQFGNMYIHTRTCVYKHTEEGFKGERMLDTLWIGSYYTSTTTIHFNVYTHIYMYTQLTRPNQGHATFMYTYAYMYTWYSDPWEKHSKDIQIKSQGSNTVHLHVHLYGYRKRMYCCLLPHSAEPSVTHVCIHNNTDGQCRHTYHSLVPRLPSACEQLLRVMTFDPT